MASSSKQNDNRVTVSSLLSPPETKKMDSFSSPMSAASIRTPTTSFSFDKMALTTPNYRNALREGTNGLPLSPPISPYESQQKEDDERMDEDTVRDPPLFPRQDLRSQLASDAPLFDQDTAISQHLATTSILPEQTPAREDYKLFVSCVLEKFSKDPWAWAAREREFAKQYGPPGKVTKQKLKPRRLAPAPLATVRRVNKTVGSVPRMPRVSRPVKRTPPTKVFDSFTFEPVTATSPKTPRPQTNRDDVDYQSLPDYSPSTETLSKGNNKVLKADWKGQPLDLSDDKDRHLLHEAEVNLAATLRLTCATYLCSKRRIFMARIETLRIGKEFRKTDAQQACKIDVNKASKLWSAFEKVGWFRNELFEHYA